MGGNGSKAVTLKHRDTENNLGNNCQNGRKSSNSVRTATGNKIEALDLIPFSKALNQSGRGHQIPTKQKKRAFSRFRKQKSMSAPTVGKSSQAFDTNKKRIPEFCHCTGDGCQGCNEAGSDHAMVEAKEQVSGKDADAETSVLTDNAETGAGDPANTGIVEMEVLRIMSENADTGVAQAIPENVQHIATQNDVANNTEGSFEITGSSANPEVSTEINLAIGTVYSLSGHKQPEIDAAVLIDVKTESIDHETRNPESSDSEESLDQYTTSEDESSDATVYEIDTESGEKVNPLEFSGETIEPNPAGPPANTNELTVEKGSCQGGQIEEFSQDSNAIYKESASSKLPLNSDSESCSWHQSVSTCLKEEHEASDRSISPSQTIRTPFREFYSRHARDSDSLDLGLSSSSDVDENGRFTCDYRSYHTVENEEEHWSSRTPPSTPEEITATKRDNSKRSTNIDWPIIIEPIRAYYKYKREVFESHEIERGYESHSTVVDWPIADPSEVQGKFENSSNKTNFQTSNKANLGSSELIKQDFDSIDRFDLKRPSKVRSKKKLYSEADQEHDSKYFGKIQSKINKSQAETVQSRKIGQGDGISSPQEPPAPVELPAKRSIWQIRGVSREPCPENQTPVLSDYPTQTPSHAKLADRPEWINNQSLFHQKLPARPEIPRPSQRPKKKLIVRRQHPSRNRLPVKKTEEIREPVSYLQQLRAKREQQTKQRSVSKSGISSGCSSINNDCRPSSSVSTASSSKRKLIIRGLKNFKESRGCGCPPTWVKEFPCRSKFNPDVYIYDFEEGPLAPKRNIHAMHQCPKRGGRCAKCGIYADEVCSSCGKCDIDCSCPHRQRPPKPDILAGTGIFNPTETLTNALSRANSFLHGTSETKGLQYPFNSYSGRLPDVPPPPSYCPPMPPPPPPPGGTPYYHPYPYPQPYMYPPPYFAPPPPPGYFQAPPPHSMPGPGPYGYSSGMPGYPEQPYYPPQHCGQSPSSQPSYKSHVTYNNYDDLSKFDT